MKNKASKKKIDYNNSYNKQHYKRFNLNLKKEDFDLMNNEIEVLCKLNDVSKRELFQLFIDTMKQVYNVTKKGDDDNE